MGLDGCGHQSDSLVRCDVGDEYDADVGNVTENDRTPEVLINGDYRSTFCRSDFYECGVAWVRSKVFAEDDIMTRSLKRISQATTGR